MNAKLLKRKNKLRLEYLICLVEKTNDILVLSFTNKQLDFMYFIASIV